MGRPKKPISVANSTTDMLHQESHDLHTETTKRHTYGRKKANKQNVSLEEEGNIEDATQRQNNSKIDTTTRMENQTKPEVEGRKKNKKSDRTKNSTLLPSTGKQDTQEGSMKDKGKRRITPTWKKTQAIAVERKSNKKSIASHGQGVELQESQLDSKSFIAVNNLQPYAREWTIKALVLRRGMVETYATAKGSGTMWKVILMDEQGTTIQAVMFNEAIDVLDRCFVREETYFISNGLVKPVNPKYSSAHKEIEITLNSNAQVEEAKQSIKLDVLKYDFIPLEHVNNGTKNHGIIDVLGLVIDVEPLSEVTKIGGAGKTIKRTITLRNLSSEPTLVTFWGDMAKNEGEMLEKRKIEKPIVALSKVKISSYAGVSSLSTISITTLQIDPSITEADLMKERFKHSLEKMPATKTKGKNKETAEQVSIADLMNRPLLEFQDTYCSFKATIIRIENIDQPWYNACKVCNKKVFEGERGMECSKCGNQNCEHHPRYLMKITVGDEERQLYVTLFEAAEKITGCSVANFIKAKEEENKGKAIEKLREASGKTYRFWAKLDKVNDKDRILGKVIAEEVQTDEELDIMEITSGIDQDNKMKKKIKIEKD